MKEKSNLNSFLTKKMESDISLDVNKVVFREGDLISNLFIIRNGSIQILAKNKNDRYVPILLLNTKDFLGVEEVLSKIPCKFYAITLEKTILTPIHQSDIDQTFKQMPEWSLKLMMTLTSRLVHSKNLLTTHSIIDDRLSKNLFTNEEESKYRKLIEGPMK